MRSIRVKTPVMVMMLRQIFIENINDIMLDDNYSIPSAEDQLNWWNNATNVKAWLYIDKNEFVGFSMLTDRGGFYTPVIAVRNGFKGMGYGRYISNDYIKKAKKPLAGAQRKDNEKVKRLNKSLGWEIVEEKGTVEYLYHPGTAKTKVIEYLKERYGL